MKHSCLYGLQTQALSFDIIELKEDDTNITVFTLTQVQTCLLQHSAQMGASYAFGKASHMHAAAAKVWPSFCTIEILCCVFQPLLLAASTI